MKMKLSIIFLTLSVILSVIACVLPNWSIKKITVDAVEMGVSRHDGLWVQCRKLNADKPTSSNDGPDCCSVIGTSTTPEPEGNIASKVLSIVGPSLLLISTLMLSIGIKHSTMVTILGIWCLLAIAIVYPLLVLNHNNNDKNNQKCHDTGITCDVGKLSTSYFLEIGAIVMAIISSLITYNKSSTRRK